MKKQTLLTLFTLTTAFTTNTVFGSASSSTSAGLPAQHSQQPLELLQARRPNPAPREGAAVAEANIPELLKAEMEIIDTALARIFAVTTPENIKDVYVFLGGTGNGKSTLINILAKQPLIVRGTALVRPANAANVSEFFQDITPGSGLNSVTKRCHLALHDSVLYIDSAGFGDVPDRSLSIASRTIESLAKYYSTSYMLDRLWQAKLKPKLVLCLKGSESSFHRGDGEPPVSKFLERLVMLGATLPHESLSVVWTRAINDFTQELVKDCVAEYETEYRRQNGRPLAPNVKELLENGFLFPVARSSVSNVQGFFETRVREFQEKMEIVEGWSNPQLKVGGVLDEGEKSRIALLVQEDGKKIVQILEKLQVSSIQGNDLGAAQGRVGVFQKFTTEAMSDTSKMFELITAEQLLDSDSLNGFKKLLSSVNALKVFATEGNDPIGLAIRVIPNEMKKSIESIQKSLGEDLKTKQAQAEAARKEQEKLAEKQRADAEKQRADEEARQRQIEQNARIAAEKEKQIAQRQADEANQRAAEAERQRNIEQQKQIKLAVKEALEDAKKQEEQKQERIRNLIALRDRPGGIFSSEETAVFTSLPNYYNCYEKDKNGAIAKNPEGRNLVEMPKLIEEITAELVRLGHQSPKSVAALKPYPKK